MRLTTGSSFARLWACCAVLAFAATAAAAPINYGDFSDYAGGGVVEYSDVTESSSTDPVPPPRYGAPSINVNTLDFDTTTFGATASNGAPAADIFDGQLNMAFSTLPGVGLSGLFIEESGDFTLFGAGDSSTAVAAGIAAEVEITHVNSVLLPAPIQVVASTQFTADLGSSPGLSQAWANGLLIDFGPALSSAGFDPNVDFVTAGEAVFSDTLAAVSQSSPDTIAFISKEDFKITPTGSLDPDNVVPEPTAVVLAGLALAGFAARRV